MASDGRYFNWVRFMFILNMTLVLLSIFILKPFSIKSPFYFNLNLCKFTLIIIIILLISTKLCKKRPSVAHEVVMDTRNI